MLRCVVEPLLSSSSSCYYYCYSLRSQGLSAEEKAELVARRFGAVMRPLLARLEALAEETHMLDGSGNGGSSRSGGGAGDGGGGGSSGSAASSAGSANGTSAPLLAPLTPHERLCVAALGPFVRKLLASLATPAPPAVVRSSETAAAEAAATAAAAAATASAAAAAAAATAAAVAMGTTGTSDETAAAAHEAASRGGALGLRCAACAALLAASSSSVAPLFWFKRWEDCLAHVRARHPSEPTGRKGDRDRLRARCVEAARAEAAAEATRVAAAARAAATGAATSVADGAALAASRAVAAKAAAEAAAAAAAATAVVEFSAPSAVWEAFRALSAALARGVHAIASDDGGRRTTASSSSSSALALADVSPALAALFRGGVGCGGGGGDDGGGGARVVLPAAHLGKSSAFGGGFGRGGTSAFVEVGGLEGAVVVLRTKTAPKRLVFVGAADGARRPYLLKGSEDLRGDERAMAVLAVANAALARRSSSSSSSSSPDAWAPGLRAGRYAVLPIAPSAGLVEWVPRAVPLFQVRRRSHAVGVTTGGEGGHKE